MSFPTEYPQFSNLLYLEGAIKAWDHDMGPSFGTPEYARTRSLGYKCSTYEGPGDEQHLHRFARHVPASIYLQNMIRAYSELYRVPNMDPQHAYSYILSKDYGSNREENEFYHEVSNTTSLSVLMACCETDQMSRFKIKGEQSRRCIETVDGLIVSEGRILLGS